eukprot:CAMPEP_0202414910 /NCGR_PEP_ID=MMETSP1128-20130828/34446_1 /ASSEMBLY_ACC=CAM_ASM_000463 /TAXON_ID=3047 /ORGANISM="Dunaliella tertiolecta, Strain CCMP1320" /LENGTH=140 /DNA_ID=CAMNT_0049021453 /DNA_START=104 /DNA_END=526 /DNA_ORIENTATION=-
MGSYEIKTLQLWRVCIPQSLQHILTDTAASSTISDVHHNAELVELAAVAQGSDAILHLVPVNALSHVHCLNYNLTCLQVWERSGHALQRGRLENFRRGETRWGDRRGLAHIAEGLLPFAGGALLALHIECLWHHKRLLHI